MICPLQYVRNCVLCVESISTARYYVESLRRTRTQNQENHPCGRPNVLGCHPSDARAVYDVAAVACPYYFCCEKTKELAWVRRSVSSHDYVVRAHYGTPRIPRFRCCYRQFHLVLSSVDIVEETVFCHAWAEPDRRQLQLLRCLESS